MATFQYHILRTIDFEGDKVLILKDDSETHLTIFDLEFDYREYEWQLKGTFTEAEYKAFITFIEGVFAFDTRGFTIKLLDIPNLPRSFDLQGPLENDYTDDSGVFNDVKLEDDVQEHMWSLWRAARENIQDPW